MRQRSELWRLLVVLQKRLKCQCTGALLFVLLLLLCLPASAQRGAPPPAPAAQPEVPKDALGRNTPRGTVLGFFNAARKEQDELAVQYLNTRLKNEKAATLSRQLFTILDRRLPAKLNALSNSPEGSLSNPLKPDIELVGSIASSNGNVDITLERVAHGTAGYIWLFSSSTLKAVPDLYEESNFAVEDSRIVLPEFLKNKRLFGILLFNWLFLIAGIPLFYFVTSALSRLVSFFVGALRRRLYRRPDLRDPVLVPRAVRLLLLGLFVRWVASSVSLPLLARQFWSVIASSIIIAGCVWLVIHLAGWGEHLIHRRLRRRNITGATSMVSLAVKVAQVLIVFAGIVVALHHFGVNPAAVLTGLGVGGIAVALAAQKTLENVVAGASLIFDHTVNAGEFIKVADTMGTVEDIGLRSTRIRTRARTLVSVPNSHFSHGRGSYP